MSNDIALKAEGYLVTFKFERYEDLQTSLKLTIVFVLDPRIGKVEAQSLALLIYLRDLYELTTYLEQHIKDLQNDPSLKESYTFVTMDLQFQLQAFSGEVRSLDDGEFTMRFMVKASRQDDESSSVYVGGETSITLENVNSFIASIRRLLTDDMSYIYDPTKTFPY